MILRIEDLQDVCKTIASAMDSNTLFAISELLELRNENKHLTLEVTNKEYYVKAEIPVDTDEKLHATISAATFLQLISHTTSDTVELSCTDKELKIRGNGNYTLPFIFENDTMMDIPVLDVGTATVDFDIKTKDLISVLKFNATQMDTGFQASPVQRLYYIDEEGAITFTTGICVNKFTLDKPVKMLLSPKLVKLFKLFDGDKVHFTMGHAEVNNIDQTRVEFKDKSIQIVSIINSDPSLMTAVPVEAARDKATTIYPYSVVLNTKSFMGAVERLRLFRGSDDVTSYSTFDFGPSSVTIYDCNDINKESVLYNKDLTNMTHNYKTCFDLKELHDILSSYTDPYITFNFGIAPAAVITRGCVYNVIAEVME